MLPNDAMQVFAPWGKTELVSMETVSVTDQPFAKAHRLNTLKSGVPQWEVQYGTWIQRPIHKGDVLLARFYLKAVRGQAETGEAKTQLVFANGAPRYDRSIGQSIGVSPNWKEYNVPFIALFETPANGAMLAFDLGFQPQSFEIGGMQLINFGTSKKLSDLPRTRSEYVGQEDDAPWRKAALERIEQLRKTDIHITVVDADGRPMPEATVVVRMRRHGFAFGTSVAADRLVSTDANGAAYRRILLENFSAAMVESHLKWPFWESWARADGDRAVDWLFQNGFHMPINGPLVWGGWGNLPDDLKAKQDDRAYLFKRIYDNMAKEIRAYEGKIHDWEVINEPYGQNDLWKIIGYDKMADMFKEARKLAPDAHLTINDYAPLDGGMKSGHLGEYHRSIEELLHAKAPVDGIGFQCHFGSNVVPPERVLSGLDWFAKFGLPISITEFDMECTDEDLQRRYLRDFFTACFSHPSVDAVLMWGFWESQHWMPSAALYRSDWSIKPNGQMWLDLVKRDWWTNADGKTDRAGQYHLRGFYGTYEIQATTSDGRSKTIYPSFAMGETSAVRITLDGHNQVAPAWIGGVDRLELERQARLVTGIPLGAGCGFNLLAEPADGTSALVEATGQPFTQARRFKVLRPTAQPWNVQALLVSTEAVGKGDRIAVSFWIRNVPGSDGGRITVNFQTGGPDYAVFGSKTVIPTADWQQVKLEVIATDACAAQETMLVLQMGHQAQSFDVGGVLVRDYGPAKPQPGSP